MRKFGFALLLATWAFEARSAFPDDLLRECQKTQIEIYEETIRAADLELAELMPLLVRFEQESLALHKDDRLCERNAQRMDYKAVSLAINLQKLRDRVSTVISEKSVYETILKKMKDVPLYEFYKIVGDRRPNVTADYIQLGGVQFQIDVAKNVAVILKKQESVIDSLQKNVVTYVPETVKSTVQSNIEKVIAKSLAKKILPSYVFEKVAAEFLTLESINFKSLVGGARTLFIAELIKQNISWQIPEPAHVRDHLRAHPEGVLFPFLLQSQGQSLKTWINYCQADAFDFTRKGAATQNSTNRLKNVYAMLEEMVPEELARRHAEERAEFNSALKRSPDKQPSESTRTLPGRFVPAGILQFRK